MEYERQVDEEYNRFLEITGRIEKLKNNLQLTLEKVACYETIQSFFGSNSVKQMNEDYYMNNAVEDSKHQIKGVSYMVGVVEPSA